MIIEKKNSNYEHPFCVFLFLKKNASNFDRNKILFFPLFQLLPFDKETIVH